MNMNAAHYGYGVSEPGSISSRSPDAPQPSTLTQKACDARNSSMKLLAMMHSLRERLRPSSEIQKNAQAEPPPPDHILFAIEGTRQALDHCHTILSEILSNL